MPQVVQFGLFYFKSCDKIIYFIKKVPGGIRCYKEHGFTYTFKRALEHLGIPMGIKMQKKK